MITNIQYRYSFTKLFGPGLNNIDQSYRVFAVDKNVPLGQRGYYEFSKTITPYLFTFSSDVLYPDTPFNDDLVIEYFGNNNIIDQAVAVTSDNDGNIRKIIDEYFTNFVKPDANNTLRSIMSLSGSSYIMPDNITFLSKHPAYGKVWVHKSYKSFSINSSKIERTFDSGLGIKINAADYKFSFSKQGSAPGAIKQPDAIGGKVIGVAKRDGKWHGSLMEF